MIKVTVYPSKGESNDHFLRMKIAIEKIVKQPIILEVKGRYVLKPTRGSIKPGRVFGASAIDWALLR